MLPSESVERKFVEELSCSGIEVMTDSGWQPVLSSNKTVMYEVWSLVLSDGDKTWTLDCADTHIVFDANMNEIFVCDLNVGDKVVVDGTERPESGVGDVLGVKEGECQGYGENVQCVSSQEATKTASVVSVYNTGKMEHMYDLSVDSDDHRYYTSGVLSHNTTTLALYIIHCVIFTEDFVAGIGSYRLSGVKDVLNRIKYTYENLPEWLKPPVKIYNTENITFTNGSSIFGQVISEQFSRGTSPSLIVLDELAFVDESVGVEAMNALLPALMAEGEASTTKAIFISTPNGSTGVFANIAFGAMANNNGFACHLVDHKLIAGRTAKFRQDMIKKMGKNKYEQEFECKWISSKAMLVDSQCIEVIVTKDPVREDKGFRVFVDSFSGRNISVAVDVSEGIGGDSHVIQVFDINTLEQIAVYANNMANQHDLTKTLIEIITFMFNEGAIEIYYGIEVNGIGAGVMRLVEAADNSYLDRATMISSTDANGVIKKNGLVMTSRSKNLGCAQLKTMLETGKLKLNDATTKLELQFFIKRGTSFAAESGMHDDHVMGLVLTMLMFMELVVYEDDINDAVNDIESEEDEIWGFSF